MSARDLSGCSLRDGSAAERRRRVLDRRHRVSASRLRPQMSSLTLACSSRSRLLTALSVTSFLLTPSGARATTGTNRRIDVAERTGLTGRRRARRAGPYPYSQAASRAGSVKLPLLKGFGIGRHSRPGRSRGSVILGVWVWASLQ